MGSLVAILENTFATQTLERLQKVELRGVDLEQESALRDSPGDAFTTRALSSV
jgi:hypothetical protein